MVATLQSQSTPPKHRARTYRRLAEIAVSGRCDALRARTELFNRIDEVRACLMFYALRDGWSEADAVREIEDLFGIGRKEPLERALAGAFDELDREEGRLPKLESVPD